jgi:hypothetical protein
MDFNRSRYESETHLVMHKTAWDRLLQAIKDEEAGQMAKARMQLALACAQELNALGFTSAMGQPFKSTELLRTIELWEKPKYLH